MSEPLIAPELLEIMACIGCRGPLRENAAEQALVCESCGLHFPVRDGIPWMLAEEAYRPDGG